MKHPAKYSDVLLPVFYEMVKDTSNLLDPFAGTCKISMLKEMGYKGKIYCNELEPEWAELGLGKVDAITTEDAEFLPYKDNFFDCICTSPTYGNRLADSHNAKDGSKRNSYTHTLGRKLHPENTGHMHWGEKYRDKHEKVWSECKRVLKNGGLLVLNMSDHIRKGEIVNVTEWHINTLENLGFKLVRKEKVETKRLRFGANSHLRLNYEYVILFKLYK